MKPLPAMFSFKHFPLCSAMKTSKTGSLSESGFAEPSNNTENKEKYPELLQKLPTFNLKTKGKDDPYQASVGSALGHLEPSKPKWPWNKLRVTFHNQFSSRNLQNALNTEFYHFSIKTGESVQECSECFQKLTDQMTCSPQLEDSLAILCNALLEELVSGFISSCITNFPTSLANAVASSWNMSQPLKARKSL